MIALLLALAALCFIFAAARVGTVPWLPLGLLFWLLTDLLPLLA